MDTRHFIGDVVLRQHDFLDFFEILRLIFFHPKYFRGCKAGKSDICCVFRKFFLSDHVVEVVGFLCCTAVVPKDGRADYSVIFVQNDKSVHLAAEADAGYLGRVKAIGKFFDASSYRVPPVLRILL